MEKERILNKAYYLIKVNFFPILLFEIVYKALGTFLLYPYVVSTFRDLLTKNGSTLLTYDTVANISLSSTVLFNLFLIIALSLLYFLFELIVITVGLDESANGRQIGIIKLLKISLTKTSQLLIVENWLSLLFIIIFIPILQLGLQTNIREMLYMRLLLNTAFGFSITRSVITILFIAEAILLILFSLVFICFIKYDVNFMTALYIDLKTIFHNFSKSFVKILKIFLILALFVLLITLVFFTVIFLIYLCVLSFNNIGSGASITGEAYRNLINVFSPMVVGYFIVLSLFIPLVYFALFFASFIPFEKDWIYTSKRSLKILSTVLAILFISIFEGTVYARGINNDEILKLQTGAIVEGHRGNSSQQLENTEASFLDAINNGADYVELDVTRTQDNVLVISHSAKMDIGSDILYVPDHTYDELLQYTFYDRDREYFTDQKLLTLDQAIDLANGRTKLNIEIKRADNEDGYIQQILDVINNHNFINQCTIASGKYEYIKQVEEANPDYNTIYLTNSNYGDFENLNFDSFSIEQGAVTKSIVNRVHLAGKTVHSWTLSNEREVQRMINMGVDYLIVDNVRMAHQVLSKNRPGYIQQFIDLLELILFQI